ncbi:hypothetical protein NMG60_11033073 [Bertholletia excelsa]
MAIPNITEICPKPMKATSNGAFQHENPLDYALPSVILQICLVVSFTRVLSLILKPLRQPRVIAEVIGGILLGPSAIGRNEKFLHTVFPVKSMTVLDTLANIGLLYFLFLVGLELDMRSIRRTGKKAFGIAVAGISLPFALGVVIAAPFLVFMGVSLSITAFPVLARILAELKLLTTDVGRMAMSVAAVNDVAAWILLALAIALSGHSTSPLICLWVLLCGLGFVLLAVFVIKPTLAVMARRSPDGEPVKELYICITLSLVLAAGFATDAIGIHALFGAFVMGIVVPKDGPFAGVLIEKVEDLVSGLLLPLYFVSSGLKGGQSWALLLLLIATACFGKIMGTVVMSLIFKASIREAFTLGFLMNTKGLVEIIVLNIGKDRGVRNHHSLLLFNLLLLYSSSLQTPMLVANKETWTRAYTPFHKHQRVDGVMESFGHSFHLVNQRVLRHATCSVGILVDRGLGGTTQVSASDVSYTVVVPFFGGKDDREALAYGARMAEHPGIELTILKFTAAPGHSLMSEGAKLVDDEGQNDQRFISECTFRKNESSTIKMEEKVVASKGDIIEALKSRGKSSIFIVGRPTQTALLMERSDNTELGPIGSYLASSDFSNAASVIVVQQYDPNANLRPLVEEQGTEEFPDTPR